MTLAALLLIGGTLVGERLIGTWATLTVGVVLVVGVYMAPVVARAVAVRRFARQLRRW